MLKRTFLKTSIAASLALMNNAMASESMNLNNIPFVDPRQFGMSADSENNSPALNEAIAEAEKRSYPVMIPGSPVPYRFQSDVILRGNGVMLAGIGGGASLLFDGCGLVVGQTDSRYRGQVLRDLTISRTGAPGPALLARVTRKARSSRFTWSNIHIAYSTGDGVAFEGAYLGSIHGLWITKCEGNGIVFRQSDNEHKNKAGANALNFSGGEVQSCEWGIVASDTKGIVFTGFTVEGNRSGGIWLRDDNRAFSFFGGYFENNAKLASGDAAYCDIRVGGVEADKQPNRNVLVSNVFFSDGKVQHENAVWIDSRQRNIVFDSPHFWAYRKHPVVLAGGDKNTSTGSIRGGANERPDRKATKKASQRPAHKNKKQKVRSLISHRQSDWL